MVIQMKFVILFIYRKFFFSPVTKTPIQTTLVFVSNLNFYSDFSAYIGTIVAMFEKENAIMIFPGNFTVGYDGLPYTNDAFDTFSAAMEPFFARFPLSLAVGPSDMDPSGGNQYPFSLIFRSCKL